MASKGEVGIDIDVDARAAARGRHGAVRGDGLRVPGADAVRGRAGERRRGAGAVREVGGRRRGDRHGHRQRAHARAARRRARRRHAGARARRRLPAVRPAARASPSAADLRRRRRRRSRRRRRPRETLLALLASPNIASRRPLFEQYDAIVQSRTVRRPEQADAAVLALPRRQRAGGQHRLQRPPRRGRPLPRHDRGGARVRGEPRVRRRRAARARPTTSTSATPRSRTSPGS